MRRNESILVYAVTGLLFVILFVAVVFGNEGAVVDDGSVAGADSGVGEAGAAVSNVPVSGGPAAAVKDPITELEQLLNLGDPVEARGAELTAAVDDKGGVGPASPDDVIAELERLGAAAVDDAEAEVAAAPTSDVPGGAEQSGRVGQFREVVVRPGDSFSLLVQRYTGDLQQMELCEALNEDIDKNRLKPGRKVILPWVDDAELTAMGAERRVEEARREQVVNTSANYKLKKGDSLWKIAMNATGDKRTAPAFVTQIMELNPELVPERLQVGQQIVLPAR